MKVLGLVVSQLDDKIIIAQENEAGIVLTPQQMDAVIKWYDAGCCALCHSMMPQTTEPSICPRCLGKFKN